jgi:hypothetical protein
MLPHGVDRDGRRRKAGIGEGADRDRDDRFPAGVVPIDGRAAIRAEPEPRLPAFVAGPDILGSPPGDRQLLAPEPRLDAERAAGPLLYNRR